MRPPTVIFPGVLTEFQSTHPVWGATKDGSITPPPLEISIHAPRVGCDCLSCSVRLVSSHFNPRTPCGVRPSGMGSRTHADVFQSTHPVWGATEFEVLGEPEKNISIHAPRVGCDVVFGVQVGFNPDFNPRTPCGVRLGTVTISFPTVLFQSTHPVWGATIESGEIFPTSLEDFNPRTPCGVRLHGCRRRLS